jgi:uncharacterized protein YybS (DUF2232 family)
MNSNLKSVLESVLIATISTALIIILSFIPVLNVVIFIWPVPFVVLGVRREPWAGIVGLIIAGLLFSIVIHPFLGFVVVVLNFFLVAGLSWAIRKRLDLFENIILSAGAVLFPAIAFFKIFSYFTGRTVFDYLADSIKRFFSYNIMDFSRIADLYYQLKIIEKPVTAEQFAEVLISQLEQFIPFVPALLLIFSLMYGTINMMVSRMVLRKLAYNVNDLPAFSDWMLPRGAGLGFMALLFIAFIGNLLNWRNFDIVFYTVFSLFSFIFSVQGLAVATFFIKLKMSKIPTFLRLLILLGVFMFIPTVLMTLGIIEQVFKLRTVFRRMNL